MVPLVRGESEVSMKTIVSIPRYLKTGNNWKKAEGLSITFEIDHPVHFLYTLAPVKIQIIEPDGLFSSGTVSFRDLVQAVETLTLAKGAS